ncbi:DUF2628 domain-containing protein [Desulfovibrio litoralis]|uniref:DUF2628 domain-containing protein n=1 Tax=Desulfovibrio litoralis DSM 11393 TaxID=1121455 RepID=A0A1M7TF00_9BACT|nr:DUF2628 domain-containing protein [Desulfovibrio litoralis]SHN69344.1 Protein of unknown function [Desulfovibrio litoralis DSM 11393]
MQEPTEQNQEQAAPQAGATQANSTTTDFPPHIDNLGVSFRLKRAFALIEKYKLTSFGMSMDTPADAKDKRTFSENLQLFSWLAFFFGPFYYFFTGMWRKGLSFLGLSIVAGLLIDLIFGMFDMGELGNGAAGFMVAYIYGSTAFYDRYRTIIKGENNFWW